jgi:hypothetical protein
LSVQPNQPNQPPTNRHFLVCSVQAMQQRARRWSQVRHFSSWSSLAQGLLQVCQVLVNEPDSVQPMGETEQRSNSHSPCGGVCWYSVAVVYANNVYSRLPSSSTVVASRFARFVTIKKTLSVVCVRRLRNNVCCCSTQRQHNVLTSNDILLFVSTTVSTILRCLWPSH